MLYVDFANGDLLLKKKTWIPKGKIITYTLYDNPTIVPRFIITSDITIIVLSIGVFVCKNITKVSDWGNIFVFDKAVGICISGSRVGDACNNLGWQEYRIWHPLSKPAVDIKLNSNIYYQW